MGGLGGGRIPPPLVGRDRAVEGREAGFSRGPLQPALWCSHSGGGEERGGGRGGS